jgi:hypothetical protein
LALAGLRGEVEGAVAQFGFAVISDAGRAAERIGGAENLHGYWQRPKKRIYILPAQLRARKHGKTGGEKQEQAFLYVHGKEAEVIIIEKAP